MTPLLLLSATLATLAVVAGVARAVHDTLTHSPQALAKWGPFWDNTDSWKRKYKDYDAGDLRPRFPGSLTWLVAFTDAWHASNAVAWLAADVAVVVVGGFAWPVWVYVAVRRVVFEPVYRRLRA